MAWREWRTVRAGLLEEILEARAYTEAKRLVDSGIDQDKLPDTDMVKLVEEIEIELVRRERKKKAKKK